MLSHNIDRRPGSRSVSIATVLTTIAIALPIAALASGQGVARFAGVIVDPSNGLLPGVEVILTNVDTQATQHVRTDRNGRFEVTALPPGRYAFETPAARFCPGPRRPHRARARRRTRLEAGAGNHPGTHHAEGRGPEGWRHDGRPIGAGAARRGAEKTRGASVPRCASAGSAIHRRQLRPPAKFVDVRPQYPPQLESDGIDGVVILQGHIGTDGSVRDLAVVSATHPDFGAAATEAVRRWEFDATLLNCVPMDVALNITVQFFAKSQD